MTMFLSVQSARLSEYEAELRDLGAGLPADLLDLDDADLCANIVCFAVIVPTKHLFI